MTDWAEVVAVELKTGCRPPGGLVGLHSHVADYSSSPGTRGLKGMLGMWACMSKIAGGKWRRRGCGVVIPPGR